MNAERQKLKDFLEEHFDFDGLKLAGFWPAGTRRTDYEQIAARVCQFFGYETVYEYARALPTCTEHEGGVTGSFPASVAADGTLHEATGFLLSTGPSTRFVCPVCEKPQDAEDYARFRRTPEYAPITCSGCKRKLLLCYPPFGSKPLEVTERA